MSDLLRQESAGLLPWPSLSNTSPSVRIYGIPLIGISYGEFFWQKSFTRWTVAMSPILFLYDTDMCASFDTVDCREWHCWSQHPIRSSVYIPLWLLIVFSGSDYPLLTAQSLVSPFLPCIIHLTYGLYQGLDPYSLSVCLVYHGSSGVLDTLGISSHATIRLTTHRLTNQHMTMCYTYVAWLIIYIAVLVTYNI